MTNSDFIQLVGATVRAGFSTLEKSANVESAAQLQILEAGWPSAEEGLSKRAALARMLATGLLVEEAEA